LVISISAASRNAADDRGGKSSWALRVRNHGEAVICCVFAPTDYQTLTEKQAVLGYTRRFAAIRVVPEERRHPRTSPALLDPGRAHGRQSHAAQELQFRNLRTEP
jgi:hypothetical protein